MKGRSYRSAGGVVLDCQQRVLLIERDVIRDGRMVHEVRLPKGHIGPGESDEEAATREVCEESGYRDVVVAADLGKAVVQFPHRGKQICREEHYFLMTCRSPSRRHTKSAKSSEERLFVPRWAADLHEAEALLTYESEKQFIRRACLAHRTAPAEGPLSSALRPAPGRP